jgi:hypothetical protein
VSKITKNAGGRCTLWNSFSLFFTDTFCSKYYHWQSGHQVLKGCAMTLELEGSLMTMHYLLFHYPFFLQSAVLASIGMKGDIRKWWNCVIWDGYKSAVIVINSCGKMELPLTFFRYWLWLQVILNMFLLASRALQGMVTLNNLISQMVNSKVMPSDPVTKALYRRFRKIKLNAKLGQLSRFLEKDNFVVVVQPKRVIKCKLIIIINFYLTKIHSCVK